MRGWGSRRHAREGWRLVRLLELRRALEDPHRADHDDTARPARARARRSALLVGLVSEFVDPLVRIRAAIAALEEQLTDETLSDKQRAQLRRRVNRGIDELARRTEQPAATTFRNGR